MNPFSGKTIASMIVIGLTTFILGLLLAGFGRDVFGHASAGANTFSTSLVGHMAFVELLRQSGLAVVVSKNTESNSANQRFPLLLLEPMDVLKNKHDFGTEPILPDKNRQDAYAERINPVLDSGAKVVVALPKRWASVSDMATGWIGSEVLMKPDMVQRILSDVLSAARCIPEQSASGSVFREATPGLFSSSVLGLESVEIKVDGPIQLIKDVPGSTPLVFSKKGTLVAALNCGIVVISDPDLFNNRALARGDNASIMLELLTEYLDARGVVVDEYLHGFITPKSLVAYALAFPLILVSIHFLLTMLLAFWSMGGYFGKPVPIAPAMSLGKDLLIDNTARLLLDGADKRDALKRYSSVLMARVAKAFGVSPKLHILQELSNNRGVQVDLARLRSSCRSVRLRQADVVRLAQRFYHWATTLLGYTDMADENEEKRGS